MLYIYADVLYQAGGIETYLHALALYLYEQNIPLKIVVAELEPCPLLEELTEKGIILYRQQRVWGDRWRLRQRIMMTWLGSQLKPGDWVYCVRQPMPQLYLPLVRLVHRRQAKLAASWMFAPEFLPPERPQFCQAIAETDAVISVSRCTVDQFKQFYGYAGPVQVVPYHNYLLFSQVVPLPPAPPWKIGFMGRLDIQQKNLDTLLKAFATIRTNWPVELHLYGRGADQEQLEQIAKDLGIGNSVFFHGAYDHRKDLPDIMENCHFFVYPSRFEGGPCFTLLELMQAGRFCVAARVGGIPDLYANHPEAGLLVSPTDVEDLIQGLTTTLERMAKGDIDGNRVRNRYFNGFDMASAHQAWKLALQI
jgi:glycosyltransferase involved in cell wall biosynthesis